MVDSRIVFAFDSFNRTIKKIPAAWVWEVSGENRVAYLIGEMHAFIDVKERDVDFSFSEYIYNISSRVYVEPVVGATNPNRKLEKLSDNISVDSWNKIVDLVKLNLDFLKISDKDKDAMNKKWLAELDGQSPVMADLNIRLLTYNKYIHAFKVKPTFEYGVSYKIEKLDALKPKARKVVALENDVILDDLWYQNCDDKITTQKYIDAALSTSDINYYWNSDKRKKIQNAFSENEDIENNFMSVWMSNSPGSELSLKCNIVPRNLLISKKIEATLAESGAPVAFVMGIGHVLGEGGVLHLLRKNGMINAK